jgi:hypothetical protein
MLAEYFGKQVRAALETRGVHGLARLVIEIEESPGQSASWETR